MTNAAVAAPHRIAGTRSASFAMGWALGALALGALALAAIAALISPERGRALAQWSGLATGVTLICIAVWLDLAESRRPSRLPLIDGAGLLAALAVAALSAHYFVARPANGGAHAAALVALLPLALWPALPGWPRERGAGASLLLRVVSLMAIAAGLAALWLTAERSAWMALVLGIGVALVILWLCRTEHANAATAVTVALFFSAALAMIAALALPMALPEWLAQRVGLWRDALPLIGDYRFTGSGLGSTEMVFASYALLTHVPYVAQVHNLYLQTALEMGLPAMVVLLAMLGVATAVTLQVLRYGCGRSQTAAAAAFAALAGSLFLGMVDAEARSGIFVAALFAPVAASMIVHAAARQGARRSGAVEFPPRQARVVTRQTAWVLLAVVCLISVAVVVGYASRTRLHAAWLANLAVVRQAQVELTDYAQAEWPFQDAIRRQKADALKKVEQGLNEALLVDATNKTAHRRLGQIALSLGEVEMAKGHLREAHLLEPDNRVSGLLLGETLALGGDAQGAATLWRPLTLNHNQLETRVNWYRALEQPEDVARMEQAVTLYLKGE